VEEPAPETTTTEADTSVVTGNEPFTRGSIKTMTDKYQSVNGQWPAGDLPVPTEQEAVAAVKRLYRLVMKKPLRLRTKITSGRRYTYARRGVMHVNAKGHYFGGWRDLVHDLSHHCHYRLHPGHKPHDGRGTHAWIERQMIEHVVNSGWLDGKLRREPKAKPVVDMKAVRHQRALASVKRWEAKLKRAETALRKLRRQARYYERQAGQQPSAPA
jgi:hypothetical protein